MKTREVITVRLDRVDQLVEARLASPFPMPRLRKEAEQFIIQCWTELAEPRKAKLTISLPECDASQGHYVRQAVHQHFAFRRDEAEKGLSRIRQLGWRTLLIGLAFLSATILVVEMMKLYLPTGRLAIVIEGGLTILAWVALWRPGELLLYEWYPFRRDARLFSKLESAEITFL